METVQTAKKELRPFHETIIDLIHSASTYDLITLARLIKMTEILKGHDQIIAIWQEQLRIYNHGDYYGVIENLLEQKKTAETTDAHPQAKALMIVIEKMIACYGHEVSRTGKLDKEMFKLFEVAKRIKRAETDAEFQSAITDL